MENRNIIFGGAIVVAIIVAALTSSGGDSSDGTSVKVRYSSDNKGWYSNSNVHFKGKEIQCNEGQTITVTHDDGSETVITCD
ncbi:hypothetical protein [Kordiimonas laminariae]|uniref:hypothetical protein n=1 Tax=Kordiimonas laminariae TaxID=2917717 RepID=UPI001FF6813C|nr:hypothetical protein [Kordiimonas laminariae]MCK0069875.1 hypothetical protein [Kordiimonas laminariae]